MQMKSKVDATSHLSESLSSTREVRASAGEVVGEEGPSFTAGGNAKWGSPYGKQIGGSSTNDKWGYHMAQQ